MLYISDYRGLSAFLNNCRAWKIAEMLGKSVTVRTDAGSYTGVAVGEDEYTVTLSCTRQIRRRRVLRRVVISKAHITAIETYQP